MDASSFASSVQRALLVSWLCAATSAGCLTLQPRPNQQLLHFSCLITFSLHWTSQLDWQLVPVSPFCRCCYRQRKLRLAASCFTSSSPRNHAPSTVFPPQSAPSSSLQWMDLSTYWILVPLPFSWNPQPLLVLCYWRQTCSSLAALASSRMDSTDWLHCYHQIRL